MRSSDIIPASVSGQTCEKEVAMSNELPPDEDGSLLKFIASTVERNRERLDSLSEGFESLSKSVATKDELRTQTTAIRGDIEQVQLRLDSIERALTARMGQIETDLSRLRSAVYLLSKERPEVLRLLGQ
jgi:hypothetical protein